MHNPQINQELFYRPLLQQFLQEWSGAELVLVIDPSMFWDTRLGLSHVRETRTGRLRYCLIEVCVAWGGRSITLNRITKIISLGLLKSCAQKLEMLKL